MGATRTRSHHSVGRGTLLNLLGQTLPFPAGVVAIPILIDRLGSTRFGFLSLLWGATAYFSMFDVGLGRATTKAVAEALAKDERKALPEIVWSANAAQCASGLVAAMLVILSAGPLARVVGGGTEAGVIEAKSAFIWMVVGIPTVLLASSWRGVLEAHRRFDLVIMIRTPITLSFFVVPLIIAIWSPYLVPMAIGLTAVQVVGSALYLMAARRLEPSIRTWVRPSWSRTKQLLGFGGWLTMSDLVAPILVYADRFMIGTILSATRIPFYTAPFDVITRLWVIPHSLVAALFPALSGKIASGAPESVHASARRGVRYVAATVGWIAALLASDAEGLLQLWLGASFAHESAGVLRLLALAILINSVAQIAHVVVLAFGRSDLAARFHLAEAPIHLLMLLVFIDAWGIEGAALAWTARVTLDAILLFAAVARLTRSDTRLLDTRFMAVLVVNTAMFSTIYLLDLGLFHPLSGAIAVAALLGLWLCALDDSDREGIVASIRRNSNGAEGASA